MRKSRRRGGGAAADDAEAPPPRAPAAFAKPPPVTGAVSAVLGNKDLLGLILAFLPPWELDHSASRVSHFFHRIAREERLWQEWSVRVFGAKDAERRKPDESWRAFFLRPHTRSGFLQSHRAGSLQGVSAKRIAAVLDVPQRPDDPSKVKFSWEFCVARGQEVHDCAVWDYKGSSSAGQTSKALKH